MSIADRLRLSYEEESTFGTFPGGTLTDLRFTSESLALALQTVSSAEIRDDRNVTNLIRTDINAAGDINFELTYGSFDVFFEMMLEVAAWGSVVNLVEADGALDIVFTAATGNIQAVGAFASGVAVGDWIQIGGMTTTGLPMNGRVYKVITVTDNDNIIVAGREALVDWTQPSHVSTNGTLDKGADIVNGTTERFISIEKYYSDISGGTPYADLTGLMFDTLALNIVADGIVTGSFGMLGKGESVLASSGGSGYTLANTNPTMTGISDVLAILEGVPAVNTDNQFEITNMTINGANNLRARKVVGVAGPKSYGSGKSAWSGTAQAYFEDQAVLDTFLAFNQSALAAIIQDSVSSGAQGIGNRYVLDYPAVKYSAGPRVAGGENTDIMVDLSWTAFRHTTEGHTVRLVRFPAI